MHSINIFELIFVPHKKLPKELPNDEMRSLTDNELPCLEVFEQRLSDIW